MPSMKWIYPIHIGDKAVFNANYSGNHLFRNHFFDYDNFHKSSRVRKDDISVGLAPLRNVEGVRKFYRTNEAMILAETREGLPQRQDSLVSSTSNLLILKEKQFLLNFLDQKYNIFV